MQYLDNESYLLDLLTKSRLISSDQRGLVTLKKDQQRQLLLRNRQKTRGPSGQKQEPEQPDMVDVIISLHLEIPGKTRLILSEDHIMKAMAADLGLPYKKLDPLDLDLDLVTKTIPKSFALKHLLLPFAMKNGVLQVAIYNPNNLTALEEIERANQISIKPFLSSKSDIHRILAEFFGFQSSISAAETHLGGPMVDLSNLEQYVKISSSSEIASTDHHIKGAVDHMFNYAFDQRASDIHLEPKRNETLIRLRIDGVLHTIYTLPKVVHPAIISRIKTLSRLDIAEKRRPQDGRIKVDREGKEAEIRVSTIPVAFGEKAVLRILDPDILFQDLSKIGFSDHDFHVYENFMKSPNGIILVTGPTGSGKSTTLYSTLKCIASPDKNIITVEDPVEMIHEEFNQISVQPQIEVTFSTILRNILRQDPDIIMIGEIRDPVTANHAIQAALTGHLVFSTLHTNDAVSSISRLRDLGVEPFLIGSTMLGAMAQRLVRTICPYCIETYSESTEVLRSFGFNLDETIIPSKETTLKLKRGKGCRECRKTGFLGRCGIFEIFPMSDRIKQMIATSEPEADIRKTALREGMTTLKDDGWLKVRQGKTTCQEAIRVIGVTHD